MHKKTWHKNLLRDAWKAICKIYHVFLHHLLHCSTKSIYSLHIGIINNFNIRTKLLCLFKLRFSFTRLQRYYEYVQSLRLFHQRIFSMVDKIVSSFFLFLSLSCNPRSYAVDDSAEREHPNLQVSAYLRTRTSKFTCISLPQKKVFLLIFSLLSHQLQYMKGKNGI